MFDCDVKLVLPHIVSSDRRLWQIESVKPFGFTAPSLTVLSSATDSSRLPRCFEADKGEASQRLGQTVGPANNTQTRTPVNGSPQLNQIERLRTAALHLMKTHGA